VRNVHFIAQEGFFFGYHKAGRCRRYRPRADRRHVQYGKEAFILCLYSIFRVYTFPKKHTAAPSEKSLVDCLPEQKGELAIVLKAPPCVKIYVMMARAPLAVLRNGHSPPSLVLGSTLSLPVTHSVEFIQNASRRRAI
jgi:hypothetical protein